MIAGSSNWIFKDLPSLNISLENNLEGMDKVIPTGIKGTDSFSVVLRISFTVFPAIIGA